MENETAQERKRRKARKHYHANRESELIRMKQRYVDNQEAEILKRREWHAANREERNERRKQWRLAHPEHTKKKMQEWYEANKDYANEKNRNWHQENKESQNAKRRQWYLDHRDYSTQYEKERAYNMRISHPWKRLLHSAKFRALKKNVPFLLDENWAKERWNGRCEVTQIEFHLGLKGSAPKFYSPSIDRIVPAMGYTPENSRFVLWAVNSLKHDATDEDMLRVAEAILSNYPYKTKA